MIHNTHVLYTKEDFTKEEMERENKLAMVVVEGGLSVCKKCGDWEAGLEEVCSATLPRHERKVK